MKTFLELLENVKSADKRPETYTKPDGKKGTRLVPADKEVIKQEKTLEWLKSALAREAKKVKPRQDDMEEAYENTMYCKKCGCERGNPDPDCSCKMENASLTDAQCYSEQSKCGSLRKEDVKNEAHDPKHVKQAVGIASDPRYKGGNMTGATKVINKLSKGLSDHPQVKAVLRRQNEGAKTFDEISKGMVGRYMKKVPGSAAHGGDQAGTGGMGQVGASPDVKKGYEKQRKSGIKTFMKRQTGTNMAVDKLTGKAKVPAK